MADREEFVAYYQDDVRKAARKAAYSSTSCTAEDIEGDLWVYLLGRFDYNAELDETHLRYLIRRQANTIAAKERRDYDHFRGGFTYTPAVVRAILADAVWTDVEEVPDLEARFDVETEFALLPLRQQQILFRHFAAGDVLNATERKDLTRAVDRIADRLNDKTPVRQVDIEDL